MALGANHFRILQDTEAFISDFQAENTNSRNAHLALIKFYVIETSAERGDQEKLMVACWEYLLNFSCKVICFQDIHQYLPYLTPQNQRKLTKLAAEISYDQRPKPSSLEVSTPPTVRPCVADAQKRPER